MQSEGLRQLARGVCAVLAGTVTTIVPTLATDYALQERGIFAKLGQTDQLFILATTYRTVFGIAGSYVTGWLAPNWPMRYVWAGGFLGFLASVAGAVSSWDAGPELGPKWYPITLVALAQPTAWFGGWLRLRKK